ncbi:MAG: type II toxin-antitoxin system Phd/YefM family antitoxin [Acidobacteria bacterium]|nr:type II toxin-antitoxin system Phd/YefM family antitoxin [Acidobacteriota bacterium]
MPTVTLSDAKTNLARLLAEVDRLGETVVITRSGRPAGVLLSISEYEGLLETLEILADPALAAAVRCGLEEADRGQTVSHEELWADVEG